MQKWASRLYVVAGILTVVGAFLKMNGKPGWEIAWICAAAAMAANLLLWRQQKDE